MSTPQSPPPPSSPEIELRMKRQRRRDTSPEVALRRALFGRGLRYRVDHKVVGRQRVDVAFTRRKVAVFVDGCFWHRCPVHGTVPVANRDWWLKKLATNEQRDRVTNAVLNEIGWVVVRVWEHESSVEAADRIQALLSAR
ncbi:MAG TPA: very short patch repair endonuclease [Acidimicrobiia bacterium]|nr:very short patch repair endonuclease [Acidimicrobiia bacterium]